jgi:uncharacterized protein involved in response to NO
LLGGFLLTASRSWFNARYPQLAMRRLDIMYLGYLAIIAQRLIEFLRLTLYPEWPASLSIHVFTFGAMGRIIPAMLIRIIKGHTSRQVVFDPFDKHLCPVSDVSGRRREAKTFSHYLIIEAPT